MLQPLQALVSGAYTAQQRKYMPCRGHIAEGGSGKPQGGQVRLGGYLQACGAGRLLAAGCGLAWSTSSRPSPIFPAMLWRIPSARSRRLPPAGFIRPARPLLTSTPRSGPEWVHEIKFDGYRLIALKDTGRVVLWSRYATDYSTTFLRIAEAVRALPFDHVMIDGEAVVFRPDGHSDFTALRTNRGAAEASFVGYDLLQFQGEDWRGMPLEVRRARLEVDRLRY